MYHNKKISIPKYNFLLPLIEQQKPLTEICRHCDYVNKTQYSFCTNCGYPLQNDALINTYYEKLKGRNDLLFKAESSVFIARIVLYIMASFMLLGILFIFTESNLKYFVAMLALIMSGLFFSLAFWSRSSPFSAMLTAFIILITFSAINIFNRLIQSFTTMQGLIGMMLCLGLLFVVMRGVQGAYRVTLMKQELQQDYE